MIYRSQVPVVSVVIPALDDAGSLARAVESCLAQEPQIVHEIIIAVGPSRDGTRDVALELAQRHPCLTVVDNPAGRTPNALNIAIDRAVGDVIVRVDARSVLPNDYIANALQLMEQTGAGNVGAIQNPVGHSPMQRAIAAAMHSPLGSGRAKYRAAKKAQKVDTAYLGVFDRAALIEVGGYDESFVRNQDAELNERLNRAGHQVWLDPRLIVDYQPRASLRGLASQYRQYGWWRRITGRKHPGSLRLRQLLPPIVVSAVVVATIVSFWVPVAAVVPLGYVAVVLAVSLGTKGLSLFERFAMAAALITMHVSWASGFLASLARRAG